MFSPELQNTKGFRDGGVGAFGLWLLGPRHYEGNANFGSNGFMVVACNKLRSVLYVLATGLYDVVFTDSDNVFRSLPSVRSGRQ